MVMVVKENHFLEEKTLGLGSTLLGNTDYMQLFVVNETLTWRSLFDLVFIIWSARAALC